MLILGRDIEKHFLISKERDRMIKQRIVFALTLLCALQSFNINASKILPGNVAAGGATSFSFGLGFARYDMGTETFYTGAGANIEEAETIKNYALAGVKSTNTAFIPNAPLTATVNGTLTNPSPLHGKAIFNIAVANRTPAVVKADTPANIYWVVSSLGATNQVIVKAENVKDANNLTASEITVMRGVGTKCIAALVAPNGGAFGDAGSGVILLQKNDLNTALTQMPIVVGSLDAKAVPFDLTADGNLAINATVTLSDTSTMWWDTQLQRLYIGLSVTGGPEEEDGARGILVGRFKNVGGVTKLFLDPIAPSDAFTSGSLDEIVGGIGRHANVEIAFVRVMHSCQGPSYLIVVGSAERHANKRVFALPLVDLSKNPANATTWATTDTEHGTLAKNILGVPVAPTTYFENALSGTPQQFSAKNFETAAANSGDPDTGPDTRAAGDLLLETHEAALVGGGQMPDTFSEIGGIQVYKDTVFVTFVEIEDDEEADPVQVTKDKSGVFYSQALFDERGVVKGWTAWQRVTHPKSGETGLSGFGYIPTLGQIFTANGDADTVSISQWGRSAQDKLLGGSTTETEGLIYQFNSEFSDNGGIFGLFDFPKEHAAFVQTADARVAMMVATGYKKVVLALASSNATSYGPFIGDFSANKKTYTNGAITADDMGDATVMISVSGGALDGLGAITSADIVIENNDGEDDGVYFVVGGTGGLAVLRQATNKYSWADTGLTAFFANIDAQTNTFTEILDYTNVKKIWGDGANLYVMTDKKLDRIAANTLDEDTPTATTVATLSSLGLATYDSFTDCAVSGKFGVIGTSQGLFRVADAADITGAPTWTKVTFPDNKIHPIEKIQVISPTAKKEEFATATSGGQLYVLENTASTEQAKVHIFDVAADGAGAVDDETLQPVSNVVVKNTLGVAIESPYFSAGYSWNHFGTDGAFLTSAMSSKNGGSATFKQVPLGVQAGSSFVKNSENAIDFGVTNPGIIRGLVRNTSLGSTLVYGDFGVRVHE